MSPWRGPACDFSTVRSGTMMRATMDLNIIHTSHHMHTQQTPMNFQCPNAFLIQSTASKAIWEAMQECGRRIARVTGLHLRMIFLSA